MHPFDVTNCPRSQRVTFHFICRERSEEWQVTVAINTMPGLATTVPCLYITAQWDRTTP